jgi:hypothetical protein
MVILDEATHKRYKYWPSELKPKSNKPILTACDECGKVREMFKYAYRALCKSCAHKGNIHALGSKRTEEQKANMSAAKKGKYMGKNNHMFGKHLTDQTKHKISEWRKGKRLSDQTKALIGAANRGGGEF